MRKITNTVILGVSVFFGASFAKAQTCPMIMGSINGRQFSEGPVFSEARNGFCRYQIPNIDYSVGMLRVSNLVLHIQQPCGPCTTSINTEFSDVARISLLGFSKSRRRSVSNHTIPFGMRNGNVCAYRTSLNVGGINIGNLEVNSILEV